VRGAIASHPDNLGGVMLSLNALVFNLRSESFAATACASDPPRYADFGTIRPQQILAATEELWQALHK
jgi:hypothetical protein